MSQVSWVPAASVMLPVALAHHWRERTHCFRMKLELAQRCQEIEQEGAYHYRWQGCSV
jgi:hypothetical protein